MAVFQWTAKRNQAAIELATGYTVAEVSERNGIALRTLYNWKADAEFAAEVDRLSLMVDISSRAERLRIAMRIVREKGYKTDRDLLDWLKLAQSETDGVKLDLTKIAAAFVGDEAPVADSRPSGASGTPPASDQDV